MNKQPYFTTTLISRGTSVSVPLYNFTCEVIKIHDLFIASAPKYFTMFLYPVFLIKVAYVSKMHHHMQLRDCGAFPREI